MLPSIISIEMAFHITSFSEVMMEIMTDNVNMETKANLFYSKFNVKTPMFCFEHLF